MPVDRFQNDSTRTDRPVIGLGFDFYGSGNIGDDLMMGGFLSAIGGAAGPLAPRVIGLCRWNIESQIRRFPAIQWQRPETDLSETDVTYWAGVGDTPFQITSGRWFLDQLIARRDHIRRFRCRVMVNVGAETEIASVSADYRNVVDVFDRISVRDGHSAEILTDILKIDSDKVRVGSDLAHIVLQELGVSGRSPAFAAGIILAGDTLNEADMREARRFLGRRSERIALIACETRLGRGYESAAYEWMRRGWFSTVRRKTSVVVPPYATGTLAELIAPVADCEVILSARYHGLLAAAWSGCRVAAISRSSKVTALAAELGVPSIPLPLDIAAMESAMRDAVRVDREKLATLARAAMEGVQFALPEIFIA